MKPIHSVITLALVCTALHAQPATVQIQGTPYDQSGVKYTGSVRVQLASTSMVTGGQTILSSLATVQIRGASASPTLSISLVPTGVGAGLPYHILTFANGDKKYCQWPASDTPLPLVGYCTPANPGAVISPVPLSWLRSTASPGNYCTVIDGAGNVTLSTSGCPGSGGGGTGIDATATWTAIEAGTSGSGSVGATSTWTAIEGM